MGPGLVLFSPPQPKTRFGPILFLGQDFWPHAEKVFGKGIASVIFRQSSQSESKESSACADKP